MPVDIKAKYEPLYQREQYRKRGIGHIYWDYRDKIALSYLDEPDRNIADLGCGEGITLEKISRLFPIRDCLGIDGLMENLLICTSHKLKVVGGDIYHLPLQKGSFDCALLLEVIEHLSNPEMAILEIHRILKPLGKLIIIFPNDAMFKIARMLTFKFKEAAFDPGHVRQWFPKDIKKFLQHYGFRILKQKNIPFFIWPLSLHHLIVCEIEG